MAQNERLQALTDAGVAVWLDQIHREMIESGDLKALVDEKSLRGETSNPAIFEKAIMGGDAYDDKIEKFAGEGLDARETYLRIAIEDVQAACDVMRPVYDSLDHYDGFVSLEVEPALARDTDATLEQAKELWEAVDRPNVMIKIPGTPECVQAIEDATAAGVNVNVTLLFSVEGYEAIAEAYIRGMERRKEAGESLDVHSVASFFVSRVDTEADKRLEADGKEDLIGLAAIANAQAAYQSFKGRFHGDRFAALKEAGAPVQRPLWASTGVKDERYDDTKYVAGLVAPETVNTMPLDTLEACAEKLEIERQHRRPGPHGDPAEAGRRRSRHGRRDRDPAERGHRQVRGAVRQADRRHRGADVQGRAGGVTETVDQRMAAALDEGVVRRIWERDQVLWGGPGPEIGNRLGWLDIADRLLEEADDLAAFAKAARDEGFTHAALLGMGGSSLGPEVIRRSYGKLDGGLELHVLDSTDPGAVRALEAAIDVEKTIFIVSSKSGGTVETLSHMKHFYELTGGNGSQFVAVTDPGSGLVDMAGERGFRRVFENDPDIGGRYSVMSYFGLVPAALAGVDVAHMCRSAAEAARECRDESDANPGLAIGVMLGTLALEGRTRPRSWSAPGSRPSASGPSS